MCFTKKQYQHDHLRGPINTVNELWPYHVFSYRNNAVSLKKMDHVHSIYPPFPITLSIKYKLVKCVCIFKHWENIIKFIQPLGYPGGSFIHGLCRPCSTISSTTYCLTRSSYCIFSVPTKAPRHSAFRWEELGSVFLGWLSFLSVASN